MRCTNCDATVPLGSSVCSECGVFAGDQAKVASRERRAGGKMWIFVTLLIIAGAAAGGWWWWTRYGQIPKPDTGPIRVVHDRPGGNVNEAEAMLMLRHQLAADRKADCVAVISRGYSNGYYSFDAVDSCQQTKLGRWRVNSKTHAVSR